MDSDKAVLLLGQLLDELEPFQSSAQQGLGDWLRRADLTLRRIVGDEHHFVEALSKTRFTVGVSPASPAAIQAAFERGKRDAASLLKGVIFELKVLREPPEFATDAAMDPELWQHVEHLVEREQWSQVASQAAIFVESKVREWAGRPATEVGEKLMTQILGENGEFPLGQTQGERQGWHRLGMGFSMALRNVDTHRIQTRSDLKRYALGVLGAGSLLLTQLRYEHGNRFKQ